MSNVKLPDIEFANRKFSAGDRLLARVATSLTFAQMKRVENAVIKAIGEHVRVLIADVRQVKLVRVRGEEAESLFGMSNSPNDPKVGQVQLDCSVIDFEPNDTLVALIPIALDESRKVLLANRLKEWTGPDVEIRIERIHFDYRHKQVSEDFGR